MRCHACWSPTTEIFYTKVINGEGKGDGSGSVAPEPRVEVGSLVGT